MTKGPKALQKEITEGIQKQRDFFQSGKTRSYEFRKTQLKKMQTAIEAFDGKIKEALYKDLRKSETEAHLVETGFVLNEVKDTIKNLAGWMKPRRVKTTLFHDVGSSAIIPEPYGNVLIISPWNYPFQLLIAPALGAMAAGNTIVLKPSELAPHTSKVIKDMISKYFSPEYITVVEGGIPETSALLNEKFDYIFYTGSTHVGRIIYQAAAKHLTPVTLELGGKSPCIVDENTNLKLTAKRIAWGKLINAGQTCVAPDYILIQKNIKEEFINLVKKYWIEFYGNKPEDSEDYCRIISERHFDRLVNLMETSGTIVHGGEIAKEDLYISPTLLDEVSPDDSVMQEEIFGPILPVLAFDKTEEAIQFVNNRPKPLALYVFSESNGFVNQVLENTSSGGVTVNDTIMHIANPHLPFGGVGESGIGAYHHQASFDTFSHLKSVLKKGFRVELPYRYAPFAKNSATLKFLAKWLN